MTNELEKTFFDTFGIEPKFVESCTKPRHKCSERFIKDCSKCPRAWGKYPQITDRILLELITFLADAFVGNYCIPDVDYNNLKSNILNDCIKYSNKGYIKYQVRTLFEEG
jgi:hypothetical protein